MVSRVLVLSLFVNIACAATAIGRLPPKPSELAHKEGCFVSNVNDVVPFGTTITPLGECIRIQCSAKFIDYATCGVVGTDDPNCHITDEDISKPYPRCCPNIKCDIDNNI